MTLFQVRDGFISARVTSSRPSLKDVTSAEIIHLARETMPYAFSRTTHHLLIIFNLIQNIEQQAETATISKMVASAY